MKQSKSSVVNSQIIMKYLFLTRSVRSDLSWSMNSLTQLVTIWHKACDESLPRLIICINQISNYRQFRHEGNEIEDYQFDFSKILHVQMTYDIQNHTQEIYRTYLDHTFDPSCWCAKSNSQLPTAVQSLKLCHLTPNYVKMIYQHYNLASATWKLYPVEQSKGFLSVTNVRKSFRLIHILIIVNFESIDIVPPDIPNDCHST